MFQTSLYFYIFTEKKLFLVGKHTADFGLLSPPASLHVNNAKRRLLHRLDSWAWGQCLQPSFFSLLFLIFFKAASSALPSASTFPSFPHLQHVHIASCLRFGISNKHFVNIYWGCGSEVQGNLSRRVGFTPAASESLEGQEGRGGSFKMCICLRPLPRDSDCVVFYYLGGRLQTCQRSKLDWAMQ